jgi:hypothetical protein
MPLETCSVQILKRVLNTLADVRHQGQTYSQWTEHRFFSFTRVCLGLAIFLGFVRLRITVSCIRYNRN